MPDRLVLALDGSTEVCTAALLTYQARQAKGAATPTWDVPTSRVEHDGRGQARVLLGLIDDMLADVDGRPDDIAAIVVGTGPGTFTGVRIAVATARSLALALDVPILGVSTLAALAADAALTAQCASLPEPSDHGNDAARTGVEPGSIVPVIDARRGQVFYGVYERILGTARSRGEAPRWRRRNDYAVCDRSELAEVLEALDSSVGEVTVVGERAALPENLEAAASETQVRVASVGAQWLVRGQYILQEPGNAPLGDRLQSYLAAYVQGQSTAGSGGERRREAVVGEVGSPESVRPIYVRAPDADVHITKMRDPWSTRG